jgi:hypothetical protein
MLAVEGAAPELVRVGAHVPLLEVDHVVLALCAGGCDWSWRLVVERA